MTIDDCGKFENDIYYLREYHPFKSGLSDDYDRKIMDLKNYESVDWKVKKQNQAEQFFLSLLKQCLEKNEAIVVCYIPRSHVGAISHIGNVANALCNHLNLINGTDCLKRYKDIAEAHEGGNRNPGRHSNSIRVAQPNLIRGANILLLDDVITSGNSMRECSDILYAAGAKSVTGLAMGLTTYE